MSAGAQALLLSQGHEVVRIMDGPARLPSGSSVTVPQLGTQTTGIQRLMGMNIPLPDAPYCGMTRPDFEASLVGFRARAGINALRVWFFQSAGGPGRWRSFDHALARAADHNMSVLAVLGNQWGDCEPWVGNWKHYKAVQWYEGGYNMTNDGYSASYRDHVHAVTERYANHPALAGWQLMNEPEARDPLDMSCPDGNRAAAALRAFADDITGVVRRNDPHHFVSVGTGAQEVCGLIADHWLYVNGGEADVCTVHGYHVPDDDIARRIKGCAAMGKPTIMGEIALCDNVVSASGNDGRCEGEVDADSLAMRAAVIGEKIEWQYGLGLSGAFLWRWATPSEPANELAFRGHDPIETVWSALAERWQGLAPLT